MRTFMTKFKEWNDFSANHPLFDCHSFEHTQVLDDIKPTIDDAVKGNWSAFNNKLFFVKKNDANLIRLMYS